MALSQGLSQIGDLGKSFDALKVTAVNTFNAIRTAIGTSGIGLLVIALAGIVAYWDDIKAAVSGVSEEQKKLNEDSAKNLKAQQDKLKAIGDQDNILKLQGKSEKDILQIKKNQTDETIKAAEVNLKNSIATAKAQTEAAQRNKDILEGILKFITLPITAVLKGIDLIGQAVGKNFGLEEKFFGGIASLVFDPEETKKKGDETIKEQEKALNDLKNQRAGYQLSIQQIDKEAAKKNNEDKIAFEKEYTKFLQDENEKRRKIRMSDFDKERFDIDKKYADLIVKAKKYGLDTSELDRLRTQDVIGLVNKTTEENKKGLDAQLSDFKVMVPQIATQQTTLTVNQAAEANNRKIINESEIESRRKMAQDISGILNGISDIFGKETAAGKATAIAAATINTYLAASQALTGIKKMNPLGAGIAIAQAALIVANGIRQVKAIASVQVPKAASSTPSISAGGGLAPMSAEPTPTVTAQALNAQAINQLGNQSMRAYILNSDMQNNEQRNAYLERNARLG
jgi:hypothetical protein